VLTTLFDKIYQTKIIKWSIEKCGDKFPANNFTVTVWYCYLFLYRISSVGSSFHCFTLVLGTEEIS
jgi:hypothetical protein